MKSIFILCVIIAGVFLPALSLPKSTTFFSHGIYLTQDTAQNIQKLNYLIRQAKVFHIDTFVIDMNYPNKQYAHNIKRVEENGLRYVARIVVFPDGGRHAQIIDQRIWEKKLALAKEAIRLGASGIQLDYIRYRAEHPGSPEKAKNIFPVVQFFQKNLAKYNVELQMDIFGIAAHGPAHTIGQDPLVFAHIVHAFCPMVYPSHYEPFRHHAVRPYETIFNSITSLKKKLHSFPHVKIYAYIELYNYRYPLSPPEKINYIRAEIKATHDSGANGWYAWSPRNLYDPLFQALK